MASATDNVYVNVIANTQGFTQKMNDALKPLRQFMQVMQSLMALGGAALIINKVAQAVGDMEKAYAKLHPESQEAVGSLQQWNETMTTLKANQGAIVSSVLTPIRKAFTDMIDPIGSATYELRMLQAEMQKIADKYLTTDRKQYKDREEALARLAEATKTWTDAVRKQDQLEAQLRQRQQEYMRAQELAKLATGTGGKISVDTTTAQKALQAAQAAVDANRKLIAEALIAQRNINEWLAANAKANDENAKAGNDLAGDLTDAEKLMLDYLEKNVGLQAQRLELAQDYMDMMDQIYNQEGGGKGGSRGTASRSVGRAVSLLREDTEEATEAVEKFKIEWEDVGYLIQDISASLGEAFVTGDYINAIKQMTQALLNFIAKEAIAAGLHMIMNGNIPMGLALMALGGITMGVNAGLQAVNNGTPTYGHTVALPGMASGGIVTRPTLAMIGEAGPEAVVPLGRGVGGTTIIVQGSIWQTEDLAVAVERAKSRW